MIELESRITDAESTYQGSLSAWEITVQTRTSSARGIPRPEISPESLPLHVLKELQEWAATGIAAYAEGNPA